MHMARMLKDAEARAGDKGDKANIGILPRDGSAADLRWVPCDPVFVFHFMNGLVLMRLFFQHQYRT